MIRYRLATITGVDGDVIVELSVLYRNLPVDFGFNGQRLRGFGPYFFITDVVGYERGKSLSEYKEFGPQGLAVGVKVLCRVDDTVPAGLVSEVIPRRTRKKARKKRN